MIISVIKQTTALVMFTLDHHFTSDSQLHQLQFVNARQHLDVLPLLDRSNGVKRPRKNNETGFSQPCKGKLFSSV